MATSKTPVDRIARLSTPIRKYGDAFFRPLSGSPSVMRPEFGDEYVKIATREGPLERLRGSLIAVLESHQTPPERTEV